MNAYELSGIGGFSVHNDSDSTDDKLTTRGHKKVRESAKSAFQNTRF